MEVVRQGTQFDVCVIGSGPAGGFITKELTEAGAKVLLLEAGAEVPPHEFAAHRWPYEWPLRGTHAERQGKFYPDAIAKHIAFKGDAIGVDRIRVLGGRSTHWNAVCLRFAEIILREGSIHGLEPDWPLTYQEIAPTSQPCMQWPQKWHGMRPGAERPCSIAFRTGITGKPSVRPALRTSVSAQRIFGGGP